MRSLRRSLAMNVFQRWRTSIPFLLALGTLLYILWAAWLGINSPFDGITSIDRNGLIDELDPRYPNAQILQPNDIVLEVDGIPYKEAFPPYAGKRAGNIVLVIDPTRRTGASGRYPASHPFDTGASHAAAASSGGVDLPGCRGWRPGFPAGPRSNQSVLPALCCLGCYADNRPDLSHLAPGGYPASSGSSS